MEPLALCALLLFAAGPAAPSDETSDLVAAAARAQAAGDAEVAARILRARATLGRTGPVPAALEPADAAARKWASGVGPLRLFASRVGTDRVRVGVDDPAEAVDRLEVVAVGAAGAARLTRAESEAAGRNEYLLPAGSDGFVEIRAFMRARGEELLLTRTRLTAPAGLPEAPTAPAPPALDPSTPPADQDVAARDAQIGWWWFVAAGVAATLVGAAVWQETRP